MRTVRSSQEEWRRGGRSRDGGPCEVCMKIGKNHLSVIKPGNVRTIRFLFLKDTSEELTWLLPALLF